ncbi:MAG: dienelactone hydrolase [Phenylobacterium sp.]|jgi:carboxymethylenebutenolidase|nr:dienelactone hydrolase [Phenylobacterium sp.]MDB5467284.1 dienelactone hydrolase [Phenylobacterium sp.]
MCDDDICQVPRSELSLSRRAFGLSAGAAAALAAAQVRAAEATVEKNVDIRTGDGVCDAALFYPKARGAWPAVLMWTDNQGLRPVFRDMGRRLAAQGYTVLVPNPFYRSRRAPVAGDGFDFAKPEDRAQITSLASTLTPEGTARDAVAFLAYLDAQPQTDRRRKAGVQGYCMGGPLTFRTAAAAPERIGAAMTFHGGNLVNDTPASPHLLIPRMKAEVRCAVARNDDQRQPDAKDRLKAAFAAARLPASVEVYPGDHGWCVAGNGSYDQAAAERAWAELSALYRTRLA